MNSFFSKRFFTTFVVFMSLVKVSSAVIAFCEVKKKGNIPVVFFVYNNNLTQRPVANSMAQATAIANHINAIVPDRSCTLFYQSGRNQFRGLPTLLLNQTGTFNPIDGDVQNFSSTIVNYLKNNQNFNGCIMVILDIQKFNQVSGLLKGSLLTHRSYPSEIFALQNLAPLALEKFELYKILKQIWE